MASRPRAPWPHAHAPTAPHANASTTPQSYELLHTPLMHALARAAQHCLRLCRRCALLPRPSPALFSCSPQVRLYTAKPRQLALMTHGGDKPPPPKKRDVLVDGVTSSAITFPTQIHIKANASFSLTHTRVPMLGPPRIRCAIPWSLRYSAHVESSFLHAMTPCQ